MRLTIDFISIVFLTILTIIVLFIITHLRPLNENEIRYLAIKDAIN